VRVSLTRRILGTPWPLVAGVLVVVALGAAYAPLGVSVAIVTASLACALIRTFGLKRGLWYLAVATLPLRQIMSIRLVGSVDLFIGDLLILALFADEVYRSGIRDLWERSSTFRIAAVIVLLSFAGLYRAFHPLWGFVSVYVIAVQVALFYIARRLIRSGPDARRTILAVVAGVVPSMLYGLYQASLPHGAALPEWSLHLTAYGPAGEPHLRIFSTLPHPLRFSHYLSMVVGLSLGLLFASLGSVKRAFVIAAGSVAVYCNLLTYSIGGALAMVVAAVAAFLATARRGAVLLVVAAAISLVFFVPTTLGTRVERLVGGQSSSAVARLITYQQSLDILRDHPIRGVGWGAIRSSLEGEYRLVRSYVVAFVAENYFLQRGLALGIPGILLYVAICVLFFRNALRSRDGPADAPWPRAAILAGGTAFYVQAQFMPSTDASVNYLAWVLLAMAEGMYEATAGARTARGAIPTKAEGGAAGGPASSDGAAVARGGS